MDTENRCAYPLSWHLLQCSHGSRVWMPRRCRRCAGCKNARRGKVLARLAHALEGQPGSAMLTLTTPPGTDWPRVMRAFQHLIKTLRATSPALQYAACKEEGSSTGMKHLHVILLHFDYTPQSLISRRWRQLTGAFVVRIERLRTDRAHYYVAKYVSKDLDAARKHVTFSRDFPKLPPPEHSFVHVKETHALGPSNVRLWVGHSGIVDVIREGCNCWEQPRPVELSDHLWLRYLQDHSPPGYRAS